MVKKCPALAVGVLLLGSYVRGFFHLRPHRPFSGRYSENPFADFFLTMVVCKHIFCPVFAFSVFEHPFTAVNTETVSAVSRLSFRNMVPDPDVYFVKV